MSTNSSSISTSNNFFTRWQDYLELCKPKVVALMVFTEFSNSSWVMEYPGATKPTTSPFSKRLGLTISSVATDGLKFWPNANGVETTKDEAADFLMKSLRLIIIRMYSNCITEFLLTSKYFLKKMSNKKECQQALFYPTTKASYSIYTFTTT